MKDSTPELRSILYDYDQHYIADLFTLYFPGITHRWTTYGFPLSYAGFTWNIGPGLDLGEVRSTSDGEVDTCQLTVLPIDTVTIANWSMLESVRRGYWDNVRVVHERAFMIEPTTVVQTIVDFDGRISQPEPSSTRIKLTLRSLLENADASAPARMTTLHCPYRLFDPYTCKATAHSNVRTIVGSPAPSVSGFYVDTSSTYIQAGGTVIVHYASGDVKRTVDVTDTFHVSVSVILPSIPPAGTLVTLETGCNRTRDWCRSYYNNLVNFGGFPDIPVWAEEK